MKAKMRSKRRSRRPRVDTRADLPGDATAEPRPAEIAAEVAGFTGITPPLKSGDMKNAMKGIWTSIGILCWIDPRSRTRTRTKRTTVSDHVTTRHRGVTWVEGAGGGLSV